MRRVSMRAADGTVDALLRKPQNGALLAYSRDFVLFGSCDAHFVTARAAGRCLYAFFIPRAVFLTPSLLAGFYSAVPRKRMAAMDFLYLLLLILLSGATLTFMHLCARLGKQK